MNLVLALGQVSPVITFSVGTIFVRPSYYQTCLDPVAHAIPETGQSHGGHVKSKGNTAKTDIHN
jgi:hypothetical protein